MDNDKFKEETLAGEEELEGTDEIEILDAPPEVLTDEMHGDSATSMLTEMTDRYQRSLAEFDNFRKRTAKEMIARHDDGVRTACEMLLPLVDNFARALAAADNTSDSFYQGVAMIARQFDGVLDALGAAEIEAAPGDKFDPVYHNAVAHVEDENFGPNEIADVLQKGYTHGDKVLRYSMVRVAN